MAYTAEDFDRFRNAWSAVPWVEPKPEEDNIIVAALRIAARVMKPGTFETPGTIENVVFAAVDKWMVEPKTPDEPHSLKTAIAAAIRKALTDG